MSLLKCAECYKEISTTADSCPNCGSKTPFKGIALTTSESKGMSYKEKMRFQKLGGKLLWNTWHKISFAIFVVFVLILIKQCNAPLSPEQQAIKDQENLISAASGTCKFFLEKQLNDPESIEYGTDMLDKIVTEESPGKWTVKLTFRAKNKFNALILSKVVCKLKQNDQNFELISIKEIN